MTCLRSIRSLTVLFALSGAITLLPSLPAHADNQNLILKDGFEGKDFSPEGGLYYKINKEQGAGRYEFETEVVRTGKQSIDLWVHPQCAQQGGLCSERAEVWERPEVLVPYGEPVWYGFSMQMAKPVPTERHRYVMAQWKRQIDPGADGDYSPLLALRLIEGKLAITVDTDTGTFEAAGSGERAAGCLKGEAAAGTPDDYSQFRTLVAIEPGGRAAPAIGFAGCTPDIMVTPRGGVLPALASGWIDFLFMVKPGPGGDGRIEIVANGNWIATVTGKIGHVGPDLGDNMYFKFGPYRAGDDNIWRLYYDNFARGPNCTDIAASDLCAKLPSSSEQKVSTP